MRAAVDLFYERVLNDPELKPFFSNTNMDRLKSHQRAFFTQALGGPAEYKGRPLAVAHQGHGITDAHFDLVAKHLGDTLGSLGVAPNLVDQVITAVAGLRGEVVV